LARRGVDPVGGAFAGGDSPPSGHSGSAALGPAFRHALPQMSP
jgi:hypothetical protein